MVSWNGRHKAIYVAFLLLTLVLVRSGCDVLGQTDQSRIPCFVIGHAEYVICCNPFRALFMQDPLFTYTLYPLPPDLSNTDKQKLDRVYYPRTGKMLVENYDVMVFHDARMEHFLTKQIHDLDYAFREAGMTALSAYSLSWDSAWLPTVLYDVAPLSDYGEHHHFVGYNVEFRRERDPVCLPFIELGMEKVIGNQFDVMVPKQGSLVWADMKPNGLPFMVSWRPGGKNAGMQWAWPNNFGQWWGVGNPMYNPYAIDLCTNIILYSLDRPLIKDLHERREARGLLTSFQAQKILILSMMEWADKFGANIFLLSGRLTDLEAEAEEAIEYYIAQDYASTISFMESMSSRISEMGEEAILLKDEALFWVFISEWLAVTSTGIVAGFVVWSLMVRRRMYKAVEATRLRLVLYIS